MKSEEPPRLYGLVYDIKEGLLQYLKVDIKSFKLYEHIYSLLEETFQEQKVNLLLK